MSEYHRTQENRIQNVSNGVTYSGVPAAMTKPFAHWNISFIKWGITENKKKKFSIHMNSFLMKPTVTFTTASRNISLAAIQLIPVAT